MTRTWTNRGQAITEYIIVVGLIAVLLMTAVSGFRHALEQALLGADQSLDGVGSVSNQYAGGGAKQPARGGSVSNQYAGSRAKRPARSSNSSTGQFNSYSGFVPDNEVFIPAAGGDPVKVYRDRNGSPVFADGTPLTRAELARVRQDP